LWDVMDPVLEVLVGCLGNGGGLPQLQHLELHMCVWVDTPCPSLDAQRSDVRARAFGCSSWREDARWRRARWQSWRRWVGLRSCGGSARATAGP
jgi:hypothetical protein